MKVKKIEPIALFDAEKWDGTNKAACDAIIGSTSIRRGDVLLYRSVRGTNTVNLTDWVIGLGEATGVLPSRIFNAQFVPV